MKEKIYSKFLFPVLENVNDFVAFSMVRNAYDMEKEDVQVSYAFGKGTDFSLNTKLQIWSVPIKSDAQDKLLDFAEENFDWDNRADMGIVKTGDIVIGSGFFLLSQRMALVAYLVEADANTKIKFFINSNRQATIDMIKGNKDLTL